MEAEEFESIRLPRELRPQRRRLEMNGRVHWGAWDPVLRRIELFGVDEREDVELLETFLHEYIHAVDPDASEERVTAAAAVWMERGAYTYAPYFGALIRQYAAEELTVSAGLHDLFDADFVDIIEA